MPNPPSNAPPRRKSRRSNASDPAAGALSPGEFAAAIARLGPFEARPRVAVAVSGGADSLALALLAHDWAGALGGAAVALTVDHALRPESAAEAAAVGDWLAARGMPHHVLRWHGAKPAGDLQAAARAARYRLLGDWCAEAGILHLLLAHHQEDQAETLLLRLGRGSGLDGLSAMAPVGETERVRLLRPLLDVPRARLRAVLDAAGQAWIEDPSNASAAFARVRMRRLLPALAAEGLTPRRLAETAARLSRARAAVEADCAAALAAHAVVHPAGWAEAAAPLLGRADELALRCLARLLACIGGRDYAPRLESLERLLDGLRRGGGGRTLAGCRVVPVRGGFRVFREPAAAAAPIAVASGDAVTWDGRFRLRIDGPAGATGEIRALGQDGWRALAATLDASTARLVPAAARPTLPALCDRGGILAVPHLGYNRTDTEGRLRIAAVRPAPPSPLTAVGHCLV